MINFCFDMNKLDSIEMWMDIAKFLTIGIVVHLLLYSVDDYGELFNEQFLKLLLYVTLSLIIYHLIIKKFITKKFFTNNTLPNINKTTKRHNNKNNQKIKQKTNKIKQTNRIKN